MTERNGDRTLICSRLRESSEIKKQMSADEKILSSIEVVSSRIVEAYKKRKKVIIFGNGGSAADAQHICAELVGKFYLNREALAAVSLTVNTSSITAIGNDFSFDDIFKKQLQGLGKIGDIVIGISTSGNSENVVRALIFARDQKMFTIGLTGQDGGRIKSRVDVCICVPSRDTPRIQEGHITIGHIICELVERRMFS